MDIGRKKLPTDFPHSRRYSYLTETKTRKKMYRAEILKGKFLRIDPELVVMICTNPGELEDGVIKFKDFPNHHIQVGHDYQNVVRENRDDTLTFFAETHDMKELFKDLHRGEL